eukprot:comp5344_c0_seq1/m.4535 comp5344_c0_seq1/g.4535  ORF comp5344_c0_seq1/g.4535 comp5344_c0_seq1/m.4535 type:complete len:156 (-) comp5344_c0_seq1:33-500(-)
MNVATKRLQKEYAAIQNEPVPYVVTRPDPTNILDWHYVLTGPAGSPYEGGEYHGIVRCPKEYPFKPPSILMYTPNGRFKINQRICMTMSDFHPESWQPAWTIGAILTGLLSFMLEKEITNGSIEASDEEKREFAANSRAHNRSNTKFKDIFSDLC